MTTAARVPYVVGQWVRGERFYGRRGLIAELLEGPRNSLWIVGTRRIGKTSLLKQLELLTSEPDEQRYFPLFWDLQGSETPEDLHLDFSDALLDAEERLARIDVDVAEIEAGDLFGSLARLRRRLRERRLRLLLLCDEVEELIHLQQQDPGLLRKLRRALQSSENIRTVLTSTVLFWKLAEERGDTSPFLHGFTPPIYLTALEEGDARELVRQSKLEQDQQPPLESAWIDEICRNGGNHPYLLQLLSKRTLEEGDAERAMEETRLDRTVRHFFSVDYELLSAAERTILDLFASQAQLTSDTMRSETGLEASALGDALQQLRSLDLLRQDQTGRYAPANPILRHWLETRGSSPSDSDSSSSSVTLDGLGMVEDRYRLLRQVGEGGTGLVYEAEDTLLSTRVALKMLRPELAHHPEILERLRQETLLSRDLGHPNILRVYHLGQHDGRPYLTMQWVEGPTLHDVLTAEAPLPERVTLTIVAKLSGALEAAHRRRILHRDVKPANVLLDTSGEPLLADFGLARAVEGDAMTQEGVFLGTPAYAAPEQANLRPADARSDIYALGVLLFEMATGRRPFEGDSVADVLEQQRHAAPPDPKSIEPATSAELSAIILRCLEKQPEARYQTAREIASALENLAAEQEEERRNRATTLVRSLAEGAAATPTETEDLLPLVYDELRQLARRHLSHERADHSLQPTALVHEAYLKLVDGKQVDWQGRTHFLAVASRAMRQLLIDHARRRRRLKRGGGGARVTLNEALTPSRPTLDEEELLALETALEELRAEEERCARVVELRFFGGLTMEEVARHLGVSKRTAEGEWTRGREWLRRALLSEPDQKE